MRAIASVTFQDDGSAVIIYMDSATDVRNGELLVMSHQLLVRPGRGSRDYLDEIEDVRDAAKRLLDDALEDWATTTDVGIPEDAAPEERDDDD